MDRVITATKLELERLGSHRPPPLASFYLGGGTPSLVPHKALAKLFQAVRQGLTLAPEAEVTLEANPDDVLPDRLREWRSLGVGRLSIGVQSLDDRILLTLGRRHTARQALTAVDLALSAGFEVSADLMIGIPGLAEGSLRRTLDALLIRGQGHISVYALETDKASPLTRRLLRAGVEIDADQAADQYLVVSRVLRNAGYRHYEVSSFARPGRFSRHNVRYWQGRAVLAAGVGACGQAGFRRWRNYRQIPTYLAAVESGRSPRRWSRRLGESEWRREQVMVRMRLARGVPMSFLEPVLKERPQLQAMLGRFLDLDLVRQRGDRMGFTPRGWLLSNELLQHLW